MTTSLDITERLTSDATGLDPEIWLPLLRLLAQGQPVELGALAEAAGKKMSEVVRALASVPDTEYDDDGRIVGQGLTLRPTSHHINIDGTALYTWCALDTLIFPTFLRTAAQIESVCHATAVPIRVTITGSGITDVEPSDAVVSLVNPDDMSAVRSAFCNQVHFFASAQAAQPWLTAHPDGTVIPVRDAYQLGSTMADTLIHQKTAGEQPTSLGTATSCC